MPLFDFPPGDWLQVLGLQGELSYLEILAAWLVLGLCALVLPLPRRLTAYLVLCTALQVLLRGPSYLAWIAVDLLVFFCAAQVGRVEWRFGPRFRWKCCCAGMIAVLAVALAGRTLRWDKVGLSTEVAFWPVFALDLYHATLLVTFLWEFGSQKIKLPPLGEFLLWRNLPLHVVFIRYSDFHGQLPRMAQKPRFAEAINRGTLLLFALALGQLVLGGVFRRAPALLHGDGPEPLWGKLLGTFLWGPWAFYLTFAGLSNAFLATGPALGMRVPVNYNAPFIRTNISEFWKNWNITLTAILRDYFFYNRWGLRRPNLYVNTMILFIGMGIWHDLNVYWVSFGVLHGLGFCAYLWYRQLNARHGGRFAIPGRAGLVLSWALTYVFVCSCWAIPSQLVKHLLH